MEDQRLARNLGRVGALLLLPVWLLYQIWLAGGRVADLSGQARAPWRNRRRR